MTSALTEKPFVKHKLDDYFQYLWHEGNNVYMLYSDAKEEYIEEIIINKLE